MDTDKAAGLRGNDPPLLREAHARLGERSTFAVGFILSVAAHLLVLLIASAWHFDNSFVDTHTLPVQPAVVREAMRVYSIVLVPAAPALAEQRVVVHVAGEPATLPHGVHGRSRDVPDGPMTASTTPAAGAHVPARADNGRRVLPGTSAASTAALEHARQRISTRLAELNDSIVPAQEAARRALDWSVRDGGKRWGYSPGFVYLGDRTVRYSLELPAAADAAARLRDFDAHRDQVQRAEVRALTRERISAMQERKAQERAQQNASTTRPARDQRR